MRFSDWNQWFARSVLTGCSGQSGSLAASNGVFCCAAVAAATLPSRLRRQLKITAKALDSIVVDRETLEAQLKEIKTGAQMIGDLPVDAEMLVNARKDVAAAHQSAVEAASQSKSAAQEAESALGRVKALEADDCGRRSFRSGYAKDHKSVPHRIVDREFGRCSGHSSCNLRPGLDWPGNDSTSTPWRRQRAS